MEFDFLLCPDAWESPLRWIFELGRFGTIAIILVAVFARSLVEFVAEFVGRRHQRVLSRLSLAFAFYGAICLLLDRYYPVVFLDYLGHTMTISNCPNY